jgi:hypothetical protein
MFDVGSPRIWIWLLLGIGHGADQKTGKFSVPPEFAENNANASGAPDALPQ